MCYYFLFALGKIYCRIKGVKFGGNLRVYGMPLIRKHPNAEIIFGNNVVINNLSAINLAGVNHKTIISAVSDMSRITIGDNSGISGGVIYAISSINIGNYVNIGANVCIYDTDFHSLDYRVRRDNLSKNVISKPIVIEDDTWIGANSIILKGVTIGKGAVIGAGSIVTKDIPSFTIWAGNPARFIKEIKDR